MSRSISRAFRPLGSMVLALVLSGCATLNPGQSLVEEAEGDLSKQPSASVLAFTVELKPDDGPSQPYRFPFEEGIYIGDMLQKSGAIKQFGRVTIELWRVSPQLGTYFKLDIPYDRKGRGVPDAYNYALQPGDRLILIEDSSNILDDMMETMIGPLGPMRHQ